MIPFGGLVDLLFGRECFVERARELIRPIRGLVIAGVAHLNFEAIESRIAGVGEANTAAAVAAFAQFPLEIEHEIPVELLAYQPGAARFAAVKNSVLDLPRRTLWAGVFDIIPS